MDSVVLARLQFAFTVGFHILWLTFTIGRASFIALLSGLWWRSRYHHADRPRVSGARLLGVPRQDEASQRLRRSLARPEGSRVTTTLRDGTARDISDASTLTPTADRSAAIARPCTALAARWASRSIGRILSIANWACVVPSACSLRILAALTPLMLGVGGCSPSLPLFGAYFPSWLLCAVFGISGALAIRVVLVRVGLDDALPLRLLVYVSLASTIACSVALLAYGQ